MTDILFITSTSKLSLRQEANGTFLLATKLLQAGFHADILRFAQMEHTPKDYSTFVQELTDRILEIAPRCVSFYTLWPYYHIMLRVSSMIKERSPQTIIILGGPQASATAVATMEAMPFVDYICTGEGENTVVPFFDALLNAHGDLADIPGLCRRVNGAVALNTTEIPLCDLNTLPRWDPYLYRAYDPKQEPGIHSDTYFMPIDAGRGCPYSCTFCCTSYFWKRMYRLKSPLRILEDIRYFHDTFGIHSFCFTHDAFTANIKLVSQFCDAIVNSGLDIMWKCTSRVDCLTEELILKMKKAGLTHIELGIETGSPRMQRMINKNLDLTRAQQMIDFLLKQKIHISLFFMYGFPEETEEDLNQTLELLFSLLDKGVHHVSMSFCRFAPETDITLRHYNDLIASSRFIALQRSIDGFSNEQDMILDNKALFSSLYHLHTPLRDHYPFIMLFTFLYQRYRKCMSLLRQLYRGNNLQFYLDFSSYWVYFSSDFYTLFHMAKAHFPNVFISVLNNFNEPYLLFLQDIMQFEYDSHTVFYSNENKCITHTYRFNYYEYKLNIPIADYTPGSTTILLKRFNGTNTLKILS